VATKKKQAPDTPARKRAQGESATAPKRKGRGARRGRGEEEDREAHARPGSGEGSDDGDGLDGERFNGDEPVSEEAELAALGGDFEAHEVEVLDPRQEKALVRSAPDEGLARLDPLQMYMREVQQHPLLTPDEERALAVRYTETGDLAAARRLVTANLRLVVKIAYEYRRAYRNMMDLVQEGNIGLMQAVKKYDPYRGVKLSSYAAWWIRAYMLRFILNNWRMVKLGTTQAQRKLFFNLNKEKARLAAMGIEPTHAELAKHLDVDEKDVVEMDKRLARSDASLDTPVSEADGRQMARVELLPAPSTGPDLATEGAELSILVREHLDEFRKTIRDKELVIFDERLAADEPQTLQQLGDRFGVSRERVRQLEVRLTNKLRDFLRDRLGDAVEIGA
jgi:RNA polymerase sigma-32 factor